MFIDMNGFFIFYPEGVVFITLIYNAINIRLFQGLHNATLTNL